MAEASTDESFVNNRGQKLIRWCLPQCTSPKAVCILVHGVGDHIASYEPPAVLMWEKHSIAMVGYDQAGHGKSEGTRVDIKDFQHYVDDLLQFVDIIKKEHSDIPLFIMGHSMGGLVLGHAVLRKPDMCNGIIMYAAAIDANPELVTPFKITMVKILSSIIPSFPVGGIGDDTLTRNQDELKRLSEDPLRHHGRMKARWGNNTLKALIDFNERMSEISIPMMIAHGASDAICRIDGSNKLNNTAVSTDKTLKVYEKCFHRIHSEPDGDGEKFVEDVCLWIEERLDRK